VPPSRRTSLWRLGTPLELFGCGVPSGPNLANQGGVAFGHRCQHRTAVFPGTDGKPMAPDEPLASRFRLHRPTSACDATVSIDLGMLSATPLPLPTPLRRRLQGGSQGESGPRLGWGRLVYAQPVRCESAAGSSCSRALSECTTTSNVHVETNLRSTNQSTSSQSLRENVILSEDY